MSRGMCLMSIYFIKWRLKIIKLGIYVKLIKLEIYVKLV